jgi:hypothetical protein
VERARGILGLILGWRQDSLCLRKHSACADGGAETVNELVADIAFILGREYGEQIGV